MCCSSAPAIRRAASWLNASSIGGAGDGSKVSALAAIPKGQCIQSRSVCSGSLATTPTLYVRKAGTILPKAALRFRVYGMRRAAAESCPVWPGQPITAHWSIPDPAAFQGTENEQRHCFARTYGALETRIKAFVSLDVERMDPTSLRQRAEEIGRMTLTETREQ